MDIKQSLRNKLLQHFQNDPEWMEFFNALLDTVDFSILSTLHAEGEDSNITVYNRTPELHEATETGYYTLVDGGTAVQPTDTLDGGTAQTPQDSLEVHDAWSSILHLEYPLTQGRTYTIIAPQEANFYYNGVRSRQILYQGGNVYVEPWTIEYLTLEASGNTGFTINYDEWNLPLFFQPGSFHNIRYAHSLYKSLWESAYDSEVGLFENITYHRLHYCKAITETTYWAPELKYCFPESSVVDQLGYWEPDGSPNEYQSGGYVDIYSFNHGLITLKEPIQDKTFAWLQEHPSRLIYKRVYSMRQDQYALGYTPNVLPLLCSTSVSELQKFIAKFTKETVPARINVPILFNQ